MYFMSGWEKKAFAFRLAILAFIQRVVLSYKHRFGPCTDPLFLLHSHTLFLSFRSHRCSLFILPDGETLSPGLVLMNELLNDVGSLPTDGGKNSTMASCVSVSRQGYVKLTRGR